MGLAHAGALTLGAPSYHLEPPQLDDSLPFLCKDKEVFAHSHPLHLPIFHLTLSTFITGQLLLKPHLDSNVGDTDGASLQNRKK